MKSQSHGETRSITRRVTKAFLEERRCSNPHKHTCLSDTAVSKHHTLHHVDIRTVPIRRLDLAMSPNVPPTRHPLHAPEHLPRGEGGRRDGVAAQRHLAARTLPHLVVPAQPVHEGARLGEGEDVGGVEEGEDVQPDLLGEPELVVVCTVLRHPHLVAVLSSFDEGEEGGDDHSLPHRLCDLSMKIMQEEIDVFLWKFLKDEGR